MSDVIGGIGSAVEGGLFARAIEPGSGAKDPHPDQPEECMNCGTPLTGAFCHACGQKGHLHRTIGAFMHDLIHGALHFEGKFWRTLPMLLFKPGKLTRRYIEGERARFVSPMALFLFGVFLMFAVFQVVGITAPTDINDEATLEETIEEARSAAQIEVDQLNAELADENTDPADREDLEARLVELQQYLEASEPLEDSAGARIGRSFAQGFSDGFNGRASQQASDAITEEVDSTVLAESETGNTRATFTGTGIDWIDDKIVAKWNENPGLMLYKLQANAYKFSWLLIPISVPFVWLLFFWKRRFRAYDHAIFVTYSLSFVTLLFITASVLGAIGVNEAFIVLPLLFIPPIHLYKQLKYTYDLGRWGAFWRLNVLSIFIWIVAILFIQLLLMLGAF